MVAATTVLFAIQAGVKLHRAGAVALDRRVATRPIGYALLKGVQFTNKSAAAWLRDYGPFGEHAATAAGRLPAGTLNRAQAISALGGAAPLERLERIVETVLRAPQGSLSADDKAFLFDAYLELQRAAGAAPSIKLADDATSSGLTVDERVALYRVGEWSKIAQWSDEERARTPSPLWTVAGTLVNLAVDYFVSTPGAVSLKSAQGRALHAFLQAIDQSTDFADSSWADISGNLLIATLDTVSAHPGLLAGGRNEERLVREMTGGMTAAAKARIGDRSLSTMEIQEIGVLLQSVGRAALKAGADTVLAQPEAFFGTPGAESDLIRRTGGALVEAVFANDKIDLRAIWSAETLQKTAQAFFAAVADNPSLIGAGDDGLNAVLQAVAADLQKHQNLLSKDALPDVLHLVFTHSANNIEALWPDDFKDGATHLLVTAGREILEAFAAATANGNWPPRLNQGALIGVMDTVFAEVVANPGWVTTKIGGDSVLKTAVQAAFNTLGKRKLTELNGPAGLEILEVALRAVAADPLLVKSLSDSGGSLVGDILDAVLTSVFDPQNAQSGWRLAQPANLTALVDNVFAAVLSNPRWLTDRVADVGGEKAILKVAIEETFAALRRNRLSAFSGDAALDIVEVVLRSASLQRAMLDLVPGDRGKRRLAGAVIDAVLAKAFAPAANDAWAVLRREGLTLVIDSALSAVADAIAQDDDNRTVALAALAHVGEQTTALIDGRTKLTDFRDALDAALAP